MIRAFLETLEDEERPLLGPNYWMMLKTGFLLPSRWVPRVVYIVIHETVTLFVATQYAELFVIRDDLDLVLTNLKISMLSVVCIFKANTFVVWQARWRRVLDFVSATDRRDRKTGDKTCRSVIATYTAYCRRLSYFYWVLVFLTFITTVIQPLVLWGTSAVLREGMRTKTLPFPHIFSSWVPWDKERSPGCWVTVLWHTPHKVLMAEYLIFGVAQLFMFCWHSNDVLYKSMTVSLGPYESGWWGGAGGGDVLLLAGQMSPHCVFSAGPFAKLTLPTFINIIKGAYSYYTLLSR